MQTGCRLLRGGWCFLVFAAAIYKMLVASEAAKWLLRNLSEAIEWFLSIGCDKRQSKTLGQQDHVGG